VGMFPVSALGAILICLSVVLGTSPSYAAESCDLRLVPGLSNERDDQWILSGRDEQCEAKRLETSRSGCTISIEFDHGWQTFSCKDGAHGHWGSRSMDSSKIYSPRKIVLPEHAALRTAWLAPVDTEGLRKNYPIRPDDYFNYYPRRFTKIGAKIAVPNPVLSATTQTLHYTTMKGERRAAISGQVAFGCLKIYFVEWVASNAAQETERRLSSLLRGLRLEPVELTQEQRREFCSVDRGR
jgi:hypothetical protein